MAAPTQQKVPQQDARPQPPRIGLDIAGDATGSLTVAVTGTPELRNIFPGLGVRTISWSG